MKCTCLATLIAALISVAMICGAADSRQDASKRVSKSGPVLHYTFESRSDDQVANEVGDQHAGECNLASFANSLSNGTSLFLRKDNSRTGYVETADHDDFNSSTITVAAWIKIRRENSNGSVVCKHDWTDGKGRGWVLRCYTSDSVNFTIGAGGWKGADGETPVPVNQWIHVAGTFDGTHLKVFFNGRLDGSIEIKQEYTPSPLPLRIGHGAYVLERTRMFDGQIDDVMIWDRALTDLEILAIHDDQKDSRPLPLTAEDIAPFVQQLGASRFNDRIEAQNRLIDFDTEVLPLLSTYSTSDDPEIVYRLNEIERAINQDLPQ